MDLASRRGQFVCSATVSPASSASPDRLAVLLDSLIGLGRFYRFMQEIWKGGIWMFRIGCSNGMENLKQAVCLALVALWAPGPAWAGEPFLLPPMASIERGEYMARDAETGTELWRLDWTLDKTSQDGRTTVRVEEDGKGIMGTQTPTRWTVHMLLDVSPRDTQFSSTRDVRDLSGQLLQVQQRELDYTTGTGRITTRNARTGDTESQSVSLPPHAIGAEILATELRGLPDQPGQQMRFVLLTMGGKTIGMLAKIVGRQRVTVPAGSFECYKVELAPSGVAGLVADLLMPKMHMWYTVAAPHIWIKYQGPEGGPGSRQIVRELVRFSPLAALHGFGSMAPPNRGIVEPFRRYQADESGRRRMSGISGG